MRILLLGPQGSGKGTQSARIAEEYGLEHVETGRMLRAAIAEGSELGRRVATIVESGRLVPDDVMIDLIRERLDGVAGFVLDGFPRTLEQARALDAMLGEVRKPLDVVLQLQVTDATARERLLSRARDEGRADDTPDAIERRLRLYHELTEPVVEHYRASGRLVGIHGERPVDGVFAEIQDALAQVEERVA